MKRVVVVAGPTASGKTALAVELALALGGEVVSADSMQIYRGLDIGTAKPTRAEMRGVPHHMLDVADPREQYSVSRYEREASAAADDILSRGALPIICGGTGLYIDALVRGTGFAAKADPALRARLEERFDAGGGEKMLAELAQRDAESAQKLHANDKKRIVRALEVLELTGEPISAHNAQTRERPPRYDADMIVLSVEPREALYGRIHARVDAMLERGLEAEARELYARGALQGTAAQAIGYKELIDYFEGRDTLCGAAETIKRKSCNYAKRQMTWLRKYSCARIISRSVGAEMPEILEEATNFLRERGLK